MTSPPPSSTCDARVSKTLGFRIRSLRQWHGERGICQGALAELAGVPPRGLRRYEKQHHLPVTAENLFRIAVALDVPMEQLLSPERREQAGRHTKESQDRAREITEGKDAGRFDDRAYKVSPWRPRGEEFSQTKKDISKGQERGRVRSRRRKRSKGPKPPDDT